jgi:hypothetical protein
LLGVVYSSFFRIEAHYNQIPDILGLSCRKFCNLVLEWLMLNVSSEAWEADYKDIFFGDPKTFERKQQAKNNIKPAVKGQEGSLNIVPKKKAEPVTDISGFLGRGGSPGKSDPNKAAKIAISEAKRKKSGGLVIKPTDSGDLSVSMDSSDG